MKTYKESMAGTLSISADYWNELEITRQDVESLHSHLFEVETPLTTHDLARVLVEARIQAEREAGLRKRQTAGKIYLPKEQYNPGDELAFPALDWKRGRVTAVRPGINPEAGEFDVINVAMEDGTERMFAACMAQHSLNKEDSSSEQDYSLRVETILSEHGSEIEKHLESALSGDGGLVRIAGRWFPRSLLVDVNQGDLNVAEAALDVAAGEPQPTSALLKDVELPPGVNPKLAEFSLNRALQDDERFDEVGPAGEVLWCLRRLEPQGVREVPFYLQYSKISYDGSVLSDEMRNLETELDDELSELEGPEQKESREVTISLIYPHLRAGTLPLSQRARSLFPTAYESPRVRFTLVDAKSGLIMPAWVVRQQRYVYGLADWYESKELMPGSLVHIKRGARPGEVIVDAQTQRANRDWVRTVIIGADGGMVFAMLKQPITAEFNDRMAIAVADHAVLDSLWTQKDRKTFEELVVTVMRELTKLTPQGHVHAQELYAAVNLMRRVPPAPLFALLASQPRFVHVGDLHYRLEEAL